MTDFSQFIVNMLELVPHSELCRRVDYGYRAVGESGERSDIPTTGVELSLGEPGFERGDCLADVGVYGLGARRDLCEPGN